MRRKIMADRKVMNRQIEESEDSQRSTERLARLIRSRKTGLQSSTEMEMLDKIARDSVLNLERVARVVSRLEEAAHRAVRTEDPFAAYVQRLLAHVETGKGPEDALEVVRKREADGLSLNVNQFIQEVVRALRRMVKKKVRLQAVLADRDVQVMADRKKMGQVRASIVAHGTEIIKKGGTITILARSLPIENDLLDKGGSGCALLSVSSTDVAANRPGSDSGNKGRAGKGLHRFLAIRSIIRGHNGSIRILRQKGALQFNIYLPVLRET
jgi:hypothetical protein